MAVGPSTGGRHARDERSPRSADARPGRRTSSAGGRGPGPPDDPGLSGAADVPERPGRDRGGGGLLRPLHGPQDARDRADRARVRGGRRRRRNLVLEPLPRRAVRRREHGVLLRLRPRARAGVGVDRALFGPARNPGLPEPRRGSLRPAPRHPARDPGRLRALLRRRIRRGVRAMEGGDERRPALDRRRLRDRGRLPVVDQRAGFPPGSTRSRERSITPVGGRTRASTSPANGSA